MWVKAGLHELIRVSRVYAGLDLFIWVYMGLCGLIDFRRALCGLIGVYMGSYSFLWIWGLEFRGFSVGFTRGCPHL